MNRALKIFLSLLLMLALPMQGYAAATMFSCGTATSQQSRDAHQGHDMRTHATGEHAHHLAAQDDGNAQHGSTSCSTCAACCVGAAVASADVDFQTPHIASRLRVISPAVLFTAHVPAGLERPPRYPLV